MPWTSSTFASPSAPGPTAPACCWRWPALDPLGGGAAATRQADEPARLRPEPDLLLCGQHSLPRRPAPGRSARRVRPPGQRRDLRPDRGQLYAAGLEPDAGPWRFWTSGASGARRPWPIVLIASGRRFSPVVGTCVYLGMGWGVVICYARIAQVVSHRSYAPVVLGGLFYSVGAVLNVLHWPTLWPRVFGAHDLFHLFVIAGSLATTGSSSRSLCRLGVALMRFPASLER